MADFVDKIVQDPKNPPATLMLTGYLGASSEHNHTRLYFDPHLSSYVEIPNDAILHKQDAKSEDGLGASYVWIKRDAELTHGAAGQERPKGTFLEGQIMQDHMAGAAVAGPQVAIPVTRLPICGGPLTLSPVQCPPPQTISPPCLPFTFGPPCPPRTIGPPCPPRTIGPPCPPRTIVLQQCPTIFVNQCPTILNRCPTRPIICNIQTAQPPCPPPTLTFICNTPITVGPQCLPRTVADPGCLASAQFVCPTFGACPSIQCGDPGGPIETPQLGAGAVAPMAQAIATITPSGVVCHTHSPGCGGGGDLPMAQFMPTNFAYCTWFMCPQG